MNSELYLLLAAAVSFALGGLVMKVSAGATRPLMTGLFLLLFLVGALLQAIAMRRADLGSAYILVLGIEAVLTFFFSAAVLRESYSPLKLIAVLLVTAGAFLLRRT